VYLVHFYAPLYTGGHSGAASSLNSALPGRFGAVKHNPRHDNKNIVLSNLFFMMVKYFRRNVSDRIYITCRGYMKVSREYSQDCQSSEAAVVVIAVFC
jgi:hypothetical protein